MQSQRLIRTLVLAAVLTACAQATPATGPELVEVPATSDARAAVPAPGTDAAAMNEVTGTWHAADGGLATRSANSFEVHGLRGHAHCDWQSVIFLSLLWPMGRAAETGELFDAGDTRQYIRDSANKLDDGALAGELDLAVEMPARATNTGYHTKSAELWLGPDGGDRYAYLVFDSHTERWPRAREHIACA